MKTIQKEDLNKKLKNENAHLIEVLEANAYEQGHIKGAINIPLKRIASEAKQRFQPDDPLIVYCADYECSASPVAAKKLESIGFNNVYDYAGGKKEWQESGMPMEK